MACTVFMRRLDQYSHALMFEVFDPQGNQIAHLKKDEKSVTRLHYHDADYDFPFSIKSIDRAEYPFPYPVGSKKAKKLGYHLLKNAEVVGEYYGETAVVEKRPIFSKKIGFEVFKYNGNTYLMVKVGLPKESSHYYCVIDAMTAETVGIIERLQANKEEARAKIYLCDEAMEELLLMVLATETVMTVTSNSEGQLIDPSAGSYLSIREEERKFLDKTFIERAKQN